MPKHVFLLQNFTSNLNQNKRQLKCTEIIVNKLGQKEIVMSYKDEKWISVILHTTCNHFQQAIIFYNVKNN